jgi:hypothetical protein
MFTTLNEWKIIQESNIRFDDYPKAAIKDAQQAIDWKKEYPNEVTAGTRVGWERANQLVNGENLSLETVKRMKAFFDRHKKNKSVNPDYKDTPWKDNGLVSWKLWGGDAGYEWAKNKLKQIEDVQTD